MGEPFVIVKAEEAETKAARFRDMIASPVLTQVKIAFTGFDAYEVEPIAVPDVLAERPVLVFGKWRGAPRGTITLNGISGDGKYTEAIDVGKIKPLQSNAALRYLWARHLTTILSDYNQLRADDRRIQEVTDLGLQYNLLTAYTSFVAVDTEVRNKDGRPATVKQPLPLPQGVSDYAVGGAMQMGYAASPMLKMARKEMAAECKDEALKSSGKGKVDKAATSAFMLKDITVTKGLTKDEFLTVMQAHLSEIEKCYAGGALPGKLILTITLNADGTVKDAQVTSGSFKNDPARQCIIGLAKTWQFPAAKDGRKVKATVTLVSGS
jgi:Ca-activated chloride channel family protein